MKIFKYRVDPSNPYVDIPDGGKILSAGVQGDEIFVWALIDESSPVSFSTELVVYGTGHNVDSDIVPQLKFIDTVFIGALVFHVFERIA